MATPLPTHYQALVQTTYAQPLTLQTVPTPSPTPGSAIIRILSVPIVSYMRDVLNGTRKYPYPTPFVPGPSAVGRIAALGPDSTAFSIGDLVFVDSVVRSRDNPADLFLLGLTQGWSQGGIKLMTDVWRNGTFAEYSCVPLENVYALREQRLCKQLAYAPRDLAILTRYLVPHGGLRAITLQAGETVIVTPATGSFGGAAVAVAVAMGAQVIATGRNAAALQRLVTHFSAERVAVVPLTDDTQADTAALLEAAGGSPIDAVLEISPPAAASSTHIKSAIMALRPKGRVALMGGIAEDYALPLGVLMHKGISLQGQFMYEREDVQGLIRMVETGRLGVGERNGVRIVGEYGFGEFEVALEKASAEAGWDTQVVMGPGE